MALLLHYTGQDYISRGLLKTELTPGSTSAIVGGCKTGKGFAFDGTVNSALYVNNIGISMPIKFTVSCWVRVNNITGMKTIFANGQLTHSGFQLDVLDNAVRAFGYNTDDVPTVANSSGGSIAANTWYHVTAGVDGSRFFLYLNGSFAKGSIMTGTIRTDYSPLIGYRFNNTPFNGQICNFKYYNHVLSQKEINEDYKSLMLHYKLDKPITTQVFDHSGFNRHIQVIENTTTNSTTEKRVYGGSLANDGTKSLYGSLNLSELNGINEISVALRFRFISQSGNHCYFSSRTTVYPIGISIFKIGGATNRDFVIDIAGRNQFTLPYDLVSGSWYDLVAVKSITDVKLYINGSLINIVSNANSISNMGQLYAAISRSIADNDIESFFIANGNVQDIRFYAKALTQADVTELYQTRQEIDNLANGYCYELVEGQSEVEMKANGQLYCDEVIENDDGTFSIEQNKTIKTKEIKEV